VGDAVYLWSGDRLTAEIVLSKKAVDSPCTVYNLHTDSPHTFFANKIAVHNKGGASSWAR
jgi:hypothetical protein